MNLSKKQRLFAKDVQKLLEYIHECGHEVTIDWAFRDLQIQQILVAQGKSKTLNSRHMNKVAIDLNLFMGGEYTDNPEDYIHLGSYWENLSEENIWGGRFGASYHPDGSFKKIGWDARHFQRML